MQVSPRIITVACFWVQHSPMFGQAASSQTVVRPSRRISARVSVTPFEVGARTRSQSGLRARVGALGTSDMAAGLFVTSFMARR